MSSPRTSSRPTGTAERTGGPGSPLRLPVAASDLTALLARRPAVLTAMLLTSTLVAFAALVWQRRWISDDGLIFLRPVRQILAGNGPVFNVGERVETNTSTVWTVVLLALAAALPGVAPEAVAIGAGLVVAVAALGFGLDAARRFAGIGRVCVPAGALVVLALPPFRDFATSGLETALTWWWLAVLWWLLVRRSQRAPRLFAEGAHRRRPGRPWPVALVIGLGPLVRPDLGLVALTAGTALLVLEQPRTRTAWARMVGLGAVAAVAPLAYTVFRAGYYGLLVPASAPAKEASLPRWADGLHYLRDTAGSWWLAVPAAALLVAAIRLARPRLRRATSPVPSTRSPRGLPPTARTRVWDRAGTVAVALVPMLGGTAMLLYVVRVGGDFMHARMLLPSIFCLLLPVMALPLRRVTVLPLVVVGVWALVAAVALGPPYPAIGSYGIADERGFYSELLAERHPVRAQDYRMHPWVGEGTDVVAASRSPVLVMQVRGLGPSGPQWQALALPPGSRDALVWLNLGVAGALAPLETRVWDTVGLASPLAAHTTVIPDGRVGHDKNLPRAWFVAVTGAALPDDRAADPADVAAANRALRCPALRELADSVSAPMTAERFWTNLVGAPERTALRFPRDPVLAEVACP